MRYRLPMALSAALIALGATSAPAKQHERAPQRSEGHVSLHVNAHSLIAGERLVVTGRVNPGGRHRVRVVVRGHSGGVSGTVTERSGHFRVRFGLPSTGVYKVRAFGLHDRRVTGSTSPRRRFTVYRRAAASYYGPGLYGGALACGGTLQPGTLGVAHKTLPCGTRVRLRYRGKTVTVAVIDRGPYVAGRDFDLTEATKAKLGFPSTGVVLSSR
jgi:hypothetical protein